MAGIGRSESDSRGQCGTAKVGALFRVASRTPMSFHMQCAVLHNQWNPIEQRLFSEISRNWSGCPPESFELILNYIASTTTRPGLVVTSRLNTSADNACVYLRAAPSGQVFDASTHQCRHLARMPEVINSITGIFPDPGQGEPQDEPLASGWRG